MSRQRTLPFGSRTGSRPREPESKPPAPHPTDRRPPGVELWYLGTVGREKLPPSKPSHRLIPPWEDHPCNVME